MPASQKNTDQLSLLSLIDESIVDPGILNQLRHDLNNMAPMDIVHYIESSPTKVRRLLWELIDSEVEGEVFGGLSEDLQKEFLQGMSSNQMAALVAGLDADDVADILQQLPDRIIPKVLEAMDNQDRQRVESILPYDEDSAGGLMNTDTITVRPDLTIDVILRYLRRHEELPDITDSIFVVNRNDTFLGTLPLGKILTSSPNITVREVMNTSTEAIPAQLSASEVAHMFERHDWVSAPVVNDLGNLLGRITIDDVVDVIIEDAEHSLFGLVGLSDEEETFTSVKRSAPRRAIWLGINLCTAVLASVVINMFEGTLDKVVALAILMPIVASMGGVAGSQTLTVVIRGMALGQVSRNNLRWLLSKEFISATLNAMLWATVIGVLASWWFDDSLIGYIIAAAMAINLLTAAVSGSLLPVILKSINIDPALAGGVMLTTITDVVGFFSFLGLATIFYV
ncbi:MAG: magnesium transporter [Gammaproteobacteria bacterium]|nr:MAG: magnesium transporter [Gammaproteobacteria bacterium]RLA53606.1 MAG: magnesium transporter [Gammaproteobacteria bacterium]